MTMAGWRKQVGQEEPIVVLEAEEHAEAAVGSGRTVDWHAAVRSGAAVVAALSLLWIGRSFADERADQAQQTCTNEIQEAYWRYENMAHQRPQSDPGEPLVPASIMTDLVARARDCGNNLFADALEYQMSSTEDE